MIEVLVALGVVAVALLGLFAVFITGTRSNQHGDDLSRATYYARKITETIRQDRLVFNTPTVPPEADTGLNDPDGFFRPIDEDPPVLLASVRRPKLDFDGNIVLDASGFAIPDPYDVKFERNIQTRRASEVSTDYRFSLMILEVTVRWQGGHSGDGMRQVKITSMVK